MGRHTAQADKGVVDTCEKQSVTDRGRKGIAIVRLEVGRGGGGGSEGEVVMRVRVR